MSLLFGKNGLEFSRKRKKTAEMTMIIPPDKDNMEIGRRMMIKKVHKMPHTAVPVINARLCFSGQLICLLEDKKK